MTTPRQRARGRYSRNYRRIRAMVLAGATHCAICGKPLDPHAAPHTPMHSTIDHVVPLSVAPHLAEVASNMRPAHHGCNSSRGAAGLAPPTTTRAW
jgi:5-methylcytosine-specific restriction endonuclease McrA